MPCTTVRTDLVLRLLVPGRTSLPVPVEMAYSAADPWAVRVTFATDHVDEDHPDESAPDVPPSPDSRDDTVVEWLVARSLLHDGMSARAGCGDMQVWPSARTGVLCLAMSSPSGEALFELDRDELSGFLRSTCALVPLGEEGSHVDLDAELLQLLTRDH